jgi:5-hydroxyisourate hydrolase
MSGITTHVLDTARGRPAAGVPVTLEFKLDDGWRVVGRGATDADGRLRDLVPSDFVLSEGDYRLTFDAGAYLSAAGADGFYTEVVVSFVVRDAAAHYHVPLLLSPYGYTTYRGS